MKKLVLKKILFFIIALLCVSFSRSQEKNIKKNDLEKMNLYGAVKSLREIQYEVIGEKTSTNSRNHKYYMFDKKGQNTECSLYKSDGSLFSKHTYKYDDKGTLLEHNSFNSDGSLHIKKTGKYDDRGNQIEWNWYFSDGIIKTETRSKYDNKGNVIELKGCDEDGKSCYKIKYKYDNKGNVIKKIELGDFPLKIKYKYDNHGKMIERNYYKFHGSLSSKVTYRYNANGDCVEVNSFDAKGKLRIKNTYKYDDNGNCIEEKVLDFFDSEIIIWHTIKYDQYNNELEYNYYDSKGISSTRYSYIYEYDKNGNWIKNISYNNNSPKYVEERKIIYY